MAAIKYHSTNQKAPEVSFPEALLNGLAPDRGLYMPDHIPGITAGELVAFKGMDYAGIALEVLYKFLANDIEYNHLKALCSEAYNFEIPLEKVYDRNYLMRLDQGPTASFKDFAARMMGRLMQHFLHQRGDTMTILTATSGDTGSAIANAFYGLDNIKVLILYPEKEVTERQRKQMTTLGKNVYVLALDGKFDDCQALVKEAFSDPELRHKGLSSANSINIGRLLPQSVYYFYAYSQLAQGVSDKIIFSVPSGNFGDLMGGLIAQRMGLPVARFVVATNANDEVPVYLRTGNYKTIVPSRDCISSAMNVGHPSNMARIIELYGGQMNDKGEILRAPDMEKLRTDMYAVSVSDTKTREVIRTVYDRHKVIVEPHGAVGWAGITDFYRENPVFSRPEQLSVTLETAHPAKFPAEIEAVLGFEPELPASLAGLDHKPEYAEKISQQYSDLKKYLIKNF